MTFLSRQDGVSLIELLVSMMLTLLVFAVALSVLDVGSPQADRQVKRSQGLDDVRVGIARMTRELRQADTVNATSPTLLDVNTPINGVQQRLVYVCDAASSTPGLRACRRYTGAVGGPVTGGAVVIDRLRNGTRAEPVFTFTPDSVRPLNVKIKAVVPARGEAVSGYAHAVVLEDGAFMRNLDLSGG